MREEKEGDKEEKEERPMDTEQEQQQQEQEKDKPQEDQTMEGCRKQFKPEFGHLHTCLLEPSQLSEAKSELNEQGTVAKLISSSMHPAPSS